jgi:arginine decarboxylase
MRHPHSYREFITGFLEKSVFSEYMHYDENGDLWFREFKIGDLVREYGSPLEICDSRLLQERGFEWKQIVRKAAATVGYTGSFDYYYASKANMSFEYANSAFASGWHSETSSAQDLEHLLWMYQNGFIGLDLKILCNGFKLPAYVSMICTMHSLGFDITPVLDSGELDYFSSMQFKKPLSVGVRLKFGKVTNDAELAGFVSRHGMEWNELVQTVERIEDRKDMIVTTFHAMVGAAENIPVHQFVDSLTFAVDKYFRLKKQCSTLTYFDIGGGIPPKHSGYDYEKFLEGFLSEVEKKANEYDLEPPVIVFELGSYLADESEFLIHTVLDRKVNSSSKSGEQEVWTTIDGGLMAELPDMLFVGKDFSVFAANNIDNPICTARLGDLSCDVDGRYPTKKAEQDTIFLPDTERETYIVIGPVGAYQRMLSGAGGAHHCGIMNPGRLIFEKKGTETVSRFIPPQQPEQYKELLGYSLNLVHGRARLRKRDVLKHLKSLLDK